MNNEKNTRLSTGGGLKTDDRKKIAFSVKQKLLAAVLSVTAVVLTCILALIYVNASDIMLKKSNELLSSSTQSVVNEVRVWMNRTITALETQRDALAYFPLDKRQKIDYIKHTAQMYDAFPAGIYVATTSGELLHSSFVPDANFDVFQKPWYTEGIGSEKFIFGSVYFDEDSKSYVVGASGVLKNRNGEIEGVAAADIYLSAISDIVQNVRLEETGGIFLADASSNMIIGHKDASLIGGKLDGQDDELYKFVAQLTKDHALGLHTFTKADGERICLELAPIPESNWIAVAYVPYREIIADVNALTKTLALAAAAGLLFLIFFIERIIHFIVKPINGLTTAITEITKGNFSIDVRSSTRDEIGRMAESLKYFIATMRSMIKKTGQISVKISAQSSASAKIAESLSGVSQRQAGDTDKMHATMNELAQSVGEVAQNAVSLSEVVADAMRQGKEAGDQMGATVAEAKRGRTHMDQVIASMDEISAKMKRLETSVQEAGASLAEIDSIVGLIRGIAAQTSLLALNASIEAARAGESGKGFAVVAEQIGKLAATSSDSVENIASLTKTIGDLAGSAMEETKDSADTIKRSAVIVDDAAGAFDLIFTSIEKADGEVKAMTGKVRQINDIAMGVAGIAEQQSAASEEILAAFDGLSANAANVLDNSKITAEDAELLAATAQELEAQMKKFTV